MTRDTPRLLSPSITEPSHVAYIRARVTSGCHHMARFNCSRHAILNVRGRHADIFLAATQVNCVDAWSVWNTEILGRIAIVNQHRRGPRQHIVGVQGADREAVRRGVRVVQPDTRDLRRAGRRLENVTSLQVLGLDKGGLRLVVERVVVGRRQVSVPGDRRDRRDRFGRRTVTVPLAGRYSPAPPPTPPGRTPPCGPPSRPGTSLSSFTRHADSPTRNHGWENRLNFASASNYYTCAPVGPDSRRGTNRRTFWTNSGMRGKGGRDALREVPRER